MKIIKINFSKDQYFQDEFTKTQIVLHHSAGWDNVRGMYSGWSSDKLKVATCSGVTDDGVIVEGFDPKFWAYHLGIPDKRNLTLNRSSIAIEICNWGGLMERGGKFYTWVNDYGRRGKAVTVPKEKVIVYDTTYLKSLGINKPNYHGFLAFEKYTQKEIDSVYEFIQSNCDRFKITKKADLSFKKSDEALSGKSGIFHHVNYRTWGEKSDTHPQPEFVQMLKSL